MEIKIYCHAVEEFANIVGGPVEEIYECYGNNADKLYFAEVDGLESSFAGVQNKDGTYNVYGCRQDEEDITFGRMLERLVSEFTQD